MKPFLFLGTRAEDVAADGEYDAVRRYAGLSTEELLRVRLERDPMPVLDLDACSGIVVGGGPFNSSDPPAEKSDVQVRVEGEMAALLDDVVDRDFPFLGACYGVGTLGVHQGAVVDRTYSEPVGPAEIELTPDGLADPLLAGMPPRFTAYLGHKEAVRELPPSATLLARSAGAPVQMFRVRRNVYATQFHPELDLAGIEQRVDVYKSYGYFAPDEAADVVANARAHRVTWPMRILRNFVERYAR
ncbi:glutamine amidotransferase [Isoptericola sp. NEAU-Y5]|uniref:Glutamine amidotransferase n=1 Tax=Isoptericola luteus TaxID=2879484 RepID=A0ABS7ZH70_9MICO|nr:glutamine amidotransferase [Isoptericola sp. NEAU-Y5]MCA5894370.1 glutamine amidotransferase [Isoptericola sp. NEAU-Y5]